MEQWWRKRQQLFLSLPPLVLTTMQCRQPRKGYSILLWAQEENEERKKKRMEQSKKMRAESLSRGRKIISKPKQEPNIKVKQKYLGSFYISLCQEL